MDLRETWWPLAIWHRVTGKTGEERPLREAAGVTPQGGFLRGAIDDDESDWRPLSGDARRDLSPVSQARMRQTAFWLWENNLIANRLIELPLAYLLAEGVALRGSDEAAQATLDRFWWDPINRMEQKLVKKARELALYGEQCYPVFVNEVDGAVRLGVLDPGRIETVVLDPDNPEQPVGIVAARDKKGVARRYKVIVNGPESLFGERARRIRETMSDGECFYFAINSTATGARGRGDLLASGDWLDAYDDFLFGEFDRARFLRAFVWDVTLTGATEEQLQKRRAKATPPGPNSVRMHNETETWQAISPSLNAGDSAENARLFRNHVLGGGTVPEHWLGGGGDVNRATGESMAEPTFKVFSMRQRELKYLLEEIGTYVLRRKAQAQSGHEPAWDDQSVWCEAIFPEMTAKDTTKYAAALQQAAVAVIALVDRGLLSEETAVRTIAALAGRLGVEVDAQAELEAARAARDKAAEADAFPGVNGQAGAAGDPEAM